NRDGSVDGNDSLLLMQALGSSTGQPAFVVGADANLDGTVDSTDAALLASDLGYVANKAPVVVPAQAMTHQDLAVSIDLNNFATDPQSNPLYFRILSALHGNAALAPDGHTVNFTPELGYTGAASFQFIADDGYGTSPTGTATVTVSAAPLIRL